MRIFGVIAVSVGMKPSCKRSVGCKSQEFGLPATSLVNFGHSARVLENKVADGVSNADGNGYKVSECLKS